MSKKGSYDIYNQGLCYMSVCSDMEPKELEARVQAENPTGVRSKWKLSKDKTFVSGHSNPNPCEKDPKRKHYLFEC